MIIVDTHVLVWAVEGNPRLGRTALRRLEDSTDAGSVLLAAISLWEIAMLVEKGRLLLDEAIDRWFERVIALPSLRLVPLDARIAIESVRLPGSFHPDPADRMIVATARTLRCPLMTADRAILAYSHLGHVETIDAES